MVPAPCNVAAPRRTSAPTVATTIDIPVGADTVGGKEVRMDWSAPVGGDPVAFYQLLVGLQPGQTFLTLTTADTFTQYGGAPPGVYYLRVRGQDVCGRNGPTSNEFRFVVP